MKNFILAANWKLNKSPLQAQRFCNDFFKLLSSQNNTNLNSIQYIFFPQALSAQATSEALSPYKNRAAWGGQHIAAFEQGAYTGENSARVLKAMGADYVLLGHSERRQLYGETEDHIQKKLQLAQSLGLKPLLCVGETLEQHEQQQTQQVLTDQLKLLKSTSHLVVAYEPVWAIGTGRTAKVADVLAAQKILKNQLPAGVPLLYGGSVKASNAAQLSPLVDGFLVGSASLDANDFFSLAQNVALRKM